MKLDQNFWKVYIALEEIKRVYPLGDKYSRNQTRRLQSRVLIVYCSFMTHNIKVITLDSAGDKVMFKELPEMWNQDHDRLHL